jgi:Uncharacterized protein conserved in bacteria (DUF2188)
MTQSIDVRCTETGTWSVLPAGGDAPLSTHTSETDAERAAQAHAAKRGARVIIHDRYERVHECPTIADPTPDAAGESQAVVEAVSPGGCTRERGITAGT